MLHPGLSNNRGLSCTWTFRTTGTCAAPVYTTGIWAVPGRVWTAGAFAAPRHVYNMGLSRTWTYIRRLQEPLLLLNLPHYRACNLYVPTLIIRGAWAAPVRIWTTGACAGLDESTSRGWAAHGRVYTTEVCAASWPVYTKESNHCCTWTCLRFRGLCCTWPCLHNKGLSFTCTCHVSG
jgi:hypothetical protein